MPRTPKYKSTLKSRTTVDVRGMSIDDILAIDPDRISRMSDADLTAVSKRLVSATNKRVRRLRASKTGKFSPALHDVPEKGFSVNFAKDKNHRNRVYEEFSRMRDFLGRKTSSAKGWRDVRRQLHEKYNAPMDPEKASDFWRGYREFAAGNPAIASGHQGSERLLKIYSDVYNEENGEPSFDALEERAGELYEQMTAEAGGYESPIFGEEDLEDDFDDWFGL